MDSSSDVFLSSDSVEPEIIAYSIEDCVIPGFHPPQPLGKLWPDGVASRLVDVSTALVYLTPGLLAICTVGNLVSGLVLRRMYPGVLSTGLYVLLALFTDTLVVWSRCGMEWMRLATNTNLREVIVTSSLILCKICPFLSNTILQLSSWLMVAMAAETAWVHQHPQRLMRVCRTGRARLIILAAVFVAVAVNCPSFWTFSLYTSPSSMSYDPSLVDEQILEEKAGSNSASSDHERPTCANEITDERLVVAATASWTGSQQDFYPSLDYRKMLLMSVDLLLTDMLPYFTIFSCAVMLVTKRLRRKDQVRQIDNTWKACNIDSGVAHQLHSTFICLCLAHTVLLFPKLVYKTFLLVTDPQVTGLVPYPVVHRPCTVVAKAVCYLLHYAFLSGKVFVLLASSTAFRGECLALVTCNSSCDPVTPVSVSEDHVTTGLPLLQQSECTVLETTSLSVPSTTSVSTGVTSSRTPPSNFVPHPPLPPVSFSHGTLTRSGKTNHVVISSTLPLHHTPNHHRIHKQEVLKSGSPKAEDLNAPTVPSAAILENGAPCIKIFSMTSV